MPDKRFLLLQDNYMSHYTLYDVLNMESVKVIHYKSAFSSRILNLLFNIHNSHRIERILDLPFKWIWDRLLFRKLVEGNAPDYIVLSISWYSTHLLSFFRRECPNSKLILRFSDTIQNSMDFLNDSVIEVLRKDFDGVLVYNKEDADKYGFIYHSVGYSVINPQLIKVKRPYDVVFIGAEKGRIDKIRQAYNLFVSAGLSCFFYVTMVKDKDRVNDGIIYADSIMPFDEYLSYECSARCLFEIVQDGSSGRTYRMMEAIIYNKLLITNCPEITNTRFFNKEYVQLFKDISDIDPLFIRKSPKEVDYQYDGDFSPLRVLDFIENTW